LERREFLARIEQIVDVDPGSLSGSERLTELRGWDSLAIVQFQAFLDEQLDAEVIPQRIEQCKTIGDLMNLAGLPLSKE
jgi:acyl carrier protein